MGFVVPVFEAVIHSAGGGVRDVGTRFARCRVLPTWLDREGCNQLSSVQAGVDAGGEDGAESQVVFLVGDAGGLVGISGSRGTDSASERIGDGGFALVW